jgi:putative aldouronate transport system permease protein
MQNKRGNITLKEQLGNDWRKNKLLYVLFFPVLVYYTVFHYLPMYGAIIAFKDFNPNLGILGSQWVGLKYFKSFFSSAYSWRVIKNTFVISLYDLLINFPAPIVFALLLNEIRKQHFKKFIQTISYMPYFLSIMVVAGMLIDFCAKDGLFNVVGTYFGIDAQSLLMNPKLFRPIYIGSQLWQSLGWGSIIYLSALTGIDPQQYDAAVIDGAGKWKQCWHVTLPGIMPTIIVMLILRMGQMMNVGFEKIILLYNPLTYGTADVISSFVYRKGLQEFNYSYSSAVGIFNSFINMIFLFSANLISRKNTGNSLF